jgi:hypothetical protein
MTNINATKLLKNAKADKTAKMLKCRSSEAGLPLITKPTINITKKRLAIKITKS